EGKWREYGRTARLNLAGIRFDNRIYKQSFGTPISSPLSPVITDLVMKRLETVSLMSLNFILFSRRFLNFNSNHSIAQKKGTIFSLVDRAFLLSDFMFHTKNLTFIINILLDNDYSLTFIFDTVNQRIKKFNDFQNRVQFYKWALQEDDMCVTKILFTDEATFTNNEQIKYSHKYAQILTEILPLLLEDLALNVRQSMRYQQDGLEKSYYSDDLKKLENCWIKCIELKGDYVEK
ncbi:hypothetical protein ALC56_14079, partial [Trachymyrmex septentrionalis]